MGGTEALVDLAFRAARAAMPKAQLVYNDYMSWETGNEKHRAGVLKLLEGFKKRGTPVNALGLQSHLVVADSAKPQETEWRKFIDAVVAMGYDLLITEFDVRDAGVAAITRAYFDMMVSYPQLRDVLVWGMVDPYSWLQNFEPRKDGQATRGCPYDAGFVAKPMRAAMAAAFKAAPRR
jgi:endo-1,4-beta-xylanase